MVQAGILSWEPLEGIGRKENLNPLISFTVTENRRGTALYEGWPHLPVTGTSTEPA